ncbi:hypothetical protein CCHR01_18711 [Colletotrichum chrysophilum]|uniref:Uncharacterized protein n=1 Tax=Colletotrichum chrysophilum TaxID=1836956 RepID=A0AAD9E8M4_9PEZI|nr:hypothetical protein CCHR01_18711 [Colletotrichum chrysophilum]
MMALRSTLQAESTLISASSIAAAIIVAGSPSDAESGSAPELLFVFRGGGMTDNALSERTYALHCRAGMKLFVCGDRRHIVTGVAWDHSGAAVADMPDGQDIGIAIQRVFSAVWQSHKDDMSSGNNLKRPRRLVSKTLDCQVRAQPSDCRREFREAIQDNKRSVRQAGCLNKTKETGQGKRDCRTRAYWRALNNWLGSFDFFTKHQHPQKLRLDEINTVDYNQVCYLHSISSRFIEQRVGLASLWRPGSIFFEKSYEHQRSILLASDVSDIFNDLSLDLQHPISKSPRITGKDPALTPADMKTRAVGNVQGDLTNENSNTSITPSYLARENFPGEGPKPPFLKDGGAPASFEDHDHGSPSNDNGEEPSSGNRDQISPEIDTQIQSSSDEGGGGI